MKRKTVARTNSKRARANKRAMAMLRERHPEFFENPQTAAIAAIVIRDLSDELLPLGAVERVALITGVMTLMYRMATAAVASISRPNSSMQDIFIEKNQTE